MVDYGHRASVDAGHSDLLAILRGGGDARRQSLPTGQTPSLNLPYFETLQKVIEQDRAHVAQKRAFLKTVNHEATGDTRRRTISTLLSGTGGG